MADNVLGLRDPLDGERNQFGRNFLPLLLVNGPLYFELESNFSKTDGIWFHDSLNSETKNRALPRQSYS